MATITDFNVSPYYDDFADSNNYHRVLFRPSFSIQARELTQAQTILQNQVERFGNNIFKEGDIVVPGGVKTTVRDSIKLTSFTGTSTLSDLKGATLTGGTSGVVAKVLETSAADGTDPNTLFVEYQNSGSNNTSTTFTGSETISGTVVISFLRFIVFHFCIILFPIFRKVCFFWIYIRISPFVCNPTNCGFITFTCCIVVIKICF